MLYVAYLLPEKTYGTMNYSYGSHLRSAKSLKGVHFLCCPLVECIRWLVCEKVDSLMSLMSFVSDVFDAVVP